MTIVGPPGIGKSRLVRETAASAAGRGVPVFTTYCGSHTTDIPFHVVARLMRATTGIDGLTPTKPEHAFEPDSRKPTLKICCSSTTCSASVIPR